MTWSSRVPPRPPRRSTHQMFVRACGNTEPHVSHLYVKHWRLIDLPLLPQPERYPAEWDSRYQCQGIRRPGMTLAESLGLEIPDNAPGGQRIASLQSYRPQGSRRNIQAVEYDGFYDVDGYGRAES